MKFTRLLLIAVFLSFVCLTAPPGAQGDSEPGSPAETPTRDIPPFDDLLWRSMVLPGWGQLHRGRYIGGVINGSLFWWRVGRAGGARAELERVRSRSFERRTLGLGYLGGHLQADPLPVLYTANYLAKLEIDEARMNYRRSLGSVGFVYGLQLLILYLTYDKPNPGESPESDVENESFIFRSRERVRFFPGDRIGENVLSSSLLFAGELELGYRRRF